MEISNPFKNSNKIILLSKIFETEISYSTLPNHKI